MEGYSRYEHIVYEDISTRATRGGEGEAIDFQHLPRTNLTRTIINTLRDIRSFMAFENLLSRGWKQTHLLTKIYGLLLAELPKNINMGEKYP